jgi:hypothetical protein
MTDRTSGALRVATVVIGVATSLLTGSSARLSAAEPDRARDAARDVAGGRTH